MKARSPQGQSPSAPSDRTVRSTRCLEGSARCLNRRSRSWGGGGARACAALAAPPNHLETVRIGTARRKQQLAEASSQAGGKSPNALPHLPALYDPEPDLLHVVGELKTERESPQLEAVKLSLPP